jgi:hypothetical protein
VNLLAEFFMAEASFIQGTDSHSVKILTDQREHAEHGKTLERHDDLAAGALLDSVQHPQIVFQCRFINNVTGRLNLAQVEVHDSILPGG